MPVISITPGGLVEPTGTSAAGPCADWPIVWACDASAIDPTVRALSVTMATEILWALSGRQFGTCEVTSRPCREECYDYPFRTHLIPWTAGSYPVPALIGGSWFNLGCGGCGNTCSCTEISEVLLPSSVHRVVRVQIDGSPMPTGSYRLDNNRLLVRTDGGLWPVCNDLSRDDTEPGTWSVTAQYGLPVPDSAQLAMGELACELSKAASGQDCRLPVGVTQLARQGVTIDFPDVGELFRQGRTGLYLVDAFLATYNPNGLKRRSRVYRVDAPPFRRAGT